jgi:hypothetical protein
MRHPSRLLLLSATVAASLGSSHAWAGRPLQTDDAGVLAAADCEVEAVTQRLSAAGQRATESSLQLGCGVGWNSQLAVAGATARTDGVRESGLALGGKTGLWKGAGRDDEASALALSWQYLSAKLPGGAWRHVGTGADLLLSMPLAAEYTLHANLGHARNELDKQRSTTWGLAIERAGFGADSRWAPMAEVFGDDREAPWVNLGLRFTAVAEKVFLDFSYGRQCSRERPTLLTVGFKAAF